MLSFHFLSAQTDSQDSVFIPLLDSALQYYGLDPDDLWLPGESVQDDPHRLRIVRQLFEQPLLIRYVLNNYYQSCSTGIEQLAFRVMQDLDLPLYKPHAIALKYPARTLDSLLGFSIDHQLSLVPASLLRQVLPAAIEATKAVEEVTSYIDSSTAMTLLQYCDSLLLPSEEAADLNVFELKAEERRWYKISENFFSSVTVSQFSGVIHTAVDCLLYLLHLPLLKGTDPELLRQVQTVEIPTPYGLIAIGGPGDDRYTKNYMLVIDVGGNDQYLFPDQSKWERVKQPFQCIIDLEGDDLYSGKDFSWGSALWGINILVDAEGDDLYYGRDFSQGVGIFGFGAIIDFSGNDRYLSRSCSQAVGAFGVGLLWDSTGNDVYQCAAQGQGFGFVGGAGILVDKSGNDLYTTSSPFVDFLRYDQHFLSFTQGAALGYRPIASGGIGGIVEMDGNDVYISDIYGQATAYWFGLGFLVDYRGDDRYVSYQYAQGAGVHFAHGALWDRDGNDQYLSHGVSQGCGHDVALGVLIDENGDDDYAVESLSQGGGNANAISLFCDFRGNDAYISRNAVNTRGYSDFRRRYGMIGIFIDALGEDWYGEVLRNNLSSVSSTFGVAIDRNILQPLPAPQQQATVPDSLKEPLAESVDSLFIQASAAPQKYQYNVQPAREKIVSMGSRALPFLAQQLATKSARERHALIDILKRMYEKDSAAVTALVLDSLRSQQIETVTMVATIAGEKKITASLPILALFLRSDNWKLRALGAYNIGLIGDTTYADTLTRYWEREEHPVVQLRLATAIVRLNPSWILDWIPEALQQSRWIIGPNIVTTYSHILDSLSLQQFLTVAQQLSHTPDGLIQWFLIFPKVSLLSIPSAFCKWLQSLPPKIQECFIVQNRNRGEEKRRKAFELHLKECAPGLFERYQNVFRSLR